MVTRKDVWRCQMLQSKSLMGTVSQKSAGYSLACTDPFLMLGESLKCKFLPLCGQREPRKLWRKSRPYPTVIPHTYCLISKHKCSQTFQVVQSFWGQLLDSMSIYSFADVPWGVSPHIILLPHTKDSALLSCQPPPVECCASHSLVSWPYNCSPPSWLHAFVCLHHLQYSHPCLAFHLSQITGHKAWSKAQEITSSISIYFVC